MPPRIKRRRLLEDKNLTAAIFEAINAHLAKRGLLMRQGTMVDATPIAAPSSTQNSTGERDPEMVSGDESEPRTAKKRQPMALWHDQPAAGRRRIPRSGSP
jgi:IS5 family transposase